MKSWHRKLATFQGDSRAHEQGGGQLGAVGAQEKICVQVYNGILNAEDSETISTSLHYLDSLDCELLRPSGTREFQKRRGGTPDATVVSLDLIAFH